MKKIAVFLMILAIMFSFSISSHAKTIGDLNSDGQITLNEAMNVFKYIAHKGDLTFKQRQYSDINNDGKVGLTDAMKLFLSVCGKYEMPEINRWIQDEFIISTFFTGYSTDFNTMKNILTLTKDAGFNLIENGWVTGETADVTIRAAEEVGIDTLIQGMDVYGGFSDKDIPLPSEELIKSVCEKYKDYKHLVGFFVWDEPTLETIPTTQKIKNMFQKFEPTKLSYSCALPSYGKYKWDRNETYAKYIDEYIKVINPPVLSFDYYPYVQAGDIIYSDLWTDMGYWRLKAQETSKPLWVYFQALSSSLQYEPGGISIEQIKTQVYPLLCYGVSGLSYYTSAGSVVYNNEKSPLYEDIKDLNKDISNIGNFLISKNNEAIYHSSVSDRIAATYRLDRIQDSDLIEAATMPFSVIGQFGEYSSTDKYILVANKHHNNTSNGQITFRHPVNIYKIDFTTMESTLVAENTTNLPIEQQPAEAILYKIQY